MVYVGNLLAESLRKETPLDGGHMAVRRIWRIDAGDLSAGQPLTWTFIEFEVSEDSATEFAGMLSTALVDGPWYCDFHNDEEVFVVFANRVFRYARGNREARDGVEQYARSMGVPEAQIDWPG